MKNSNTSGLKYHLGKQHKKEHEQLFGLLECTQIEKGKSKISMQQRLDTYINVSKIKILFLFSFLLPFYVYSYRFILLENFLK